jgi:hypothetical protein
MGLSRQRAMAYLVRHRQAAGAGTTSTRSWERARTGCPAYLALALAQKRDPRALVAAHDAWSRLHRRRWRSAGWAYNDRVPTDADSTVWAMRLASALDARVGAVGGQH